MQNKFCSGIILILVQAIWLVDIFEGTLEDKETNEETKPPATKRKKETKPG